jgi:hypothetical protein
MNLWKSTCWTLICSLAIAVSSCSSGSGGGTTPGTVQSGSQDLTQDPNGTTTVVTFSKAPASVAPSYFTADGGQNATGAVLAGVDVTVTWDARVSPAHTISVIGMPGILDGSTVPTTTDGSAPTFTVTGSSMTPGLGGDTIEVTFSGPRVDETDAEDLSSWTLEVASTPLDLTGSSFDLDVPTQVLSVTLGPDANLHSTFSLAATSLVSVADTGLSSTPVGGTASGDAVAPILISVVQNLSDDEFGRVVDFTFDEAMDPAFSQSIANFSVTGNNTATSVSQPSAGVLRVTFNGPVVPGEDEITPSNMMDVHGNSVALGAQAVTQPSPVTNLFSTNDAVTVENVGGDYIEATFVQAFTQAEGEDDTNWTLVVDSDPITLADQTLSYDFLNKRLRIDLDFDMENGTAFTLTGVGVLEVDGQTFSTAGPGVVGGDVLLPTVTGALQNRTQDPTGKTVDVTFSEDIDASAVSTLSNWTVGALGVANAALLGTPNVVRLTLTGGAAVPGVETVDVTGQADIAGNSMVAAFGIAITSTDSTVPSLTTATGNAPEGANNDLVSVWFDDDMVEAQVESAVNWTIESPIGTPLDTSGATVVYNNATRSAVFTFDASNDVFFQLGDGFRVSLSGVTDISANTLSTNAIDGAITFEREHPYADNAWRDALLNTEVVVRFNEHMNYLTDLYVAGSNTEGVRYLVRDGGGAMRGFPSSATQLDDGLGVRLNFGFVISATDTLDVMGATDLVGNYMYPALTLSLDAEDTAEPDWGVQVTPLLAVSGERNDVITLSFDLDISPWGAENHENYTVNDGSNDLGLKSADFQFDGVDTVVITLDGSDADSLTATDTYDFTVDGLQSEQGVQMSVASALPGNLVSGDTSTAPVVGPSDVRIDRSFPNAIIVYSDEALDPVTAEDETRWAYNGATLPMLATLVDPTTVRLTFVTPPASGNPLNFNVSDLAGNASGAAAQNVLPSENVPPALLSIAGTSIPGEGGDYITVVFDEPVDSTSGLLVGNFSVTNDGSPLSLTSAGAWYESTTNSVNFCLASGFEFDSDESINVTVSNVSDHSGNVMVAPVGLFGTVSGDTTTPPGALGAFTNYRENSFGLLVDVLFDEAPDEAFVTNPFNWNVTGGGLQVVLGVTRIDEDEYRVSLSGALGSSNELELIAGLPDLAGNLTVAATAVIVTE